MLTLLGVGAFMLWGAGHYTVFDDEGFSCRRYSMPLGEMVSALWRGAEPDPPLYYILQNIWVHHFGVGPLGLRSLSIGMFLIGLLFIRLAGTEWYDERVGRLAMLIAATHPAHLLFGLAGRWYSAMFLAVAILFWLTAILNRPGPGQRKTTLAWSLAATAVCYTNYFGVVVVGLLWSIIDFRSQNRVRWVKAASVALVLYAAWLPAFWKQATSFPQLTLSWSRYADTGIRLMMAFTTGNFASITALWVWAPIFVCFFSCCILIKIMAAKHPRSEPLAQIVAACFLAAIASRTIIDKYVMTFSGPACIIFAMVALRNWQKEKARWTVLLVRVIVASLILGWIGCYVNLALSGIGRELVMQSLRKSTA